MDVSIFHPSELSDPSLTSSVDGPRDLPANIHLVTPGETITSDPQFMKGHGVYTSPASPSDLISSAAGVVDRVNKLITVRTLRSRYTGHVGDVVVGRVTDLGPRRWRIDINSFQDAHLQLSAIHLPGGVQRRKTEADELEMRKYFAEGDVLVSEVQSPNASDASFNLHTRSTKYGKLRNGCLVVVPPALIQRCKSHFHSLPNGVDVILGLNGYIWVAMSAAQAQAQQQQAAAASITAIDPDRIATESLYSSKNDVIPRETRANIARVANVIRALARSDLPISDTMIVYGYEASLAYDKVSDLLKPEVVREVAGQARKLYEYSMM